MQIIKCDECGSEDVKKAGHNTWRVVDKEKHIRQKMQRWQCNSCGKIFIVRNGKAKEENIK